MAIQYVIYGYTKEQRPKAMFYAIVAFRGRKYYHVLGRAVGETAIARKATMLDAAPGYVDIPQLPTFTKADTGTLHRFATGERA